MVWQLTLQAWAFKGLDHEPRLAEMLAYYPRPEPTSW
jgi:hypothetical protein